MKNKGFTLIEVIVALTLMAIVGLILAVNIKGLKENQNESAYNRLVDRIETATDSYLNNNVGLRNEVFEHPGQIIKISLNTLVEEGLLDEEDLVNPYTNQKMQNEVNVRAVDRVLEIKYQREE